jgi:nitrite reductase/ring-hydroxylating ferredoxin subunit
MTGSWQSYRGAPAPGTRLCALNDLPETGTKSLDLDGFPILLIRVRSRLHAYVNACPHQYLPLDHKGGQLLSADGARIRCTNHSAGFCVETGDGVEGLGIGTCLDAIPIVIRSEDVLIGVCDD